jgi:TolB-like protein
VLAPVEATPRPGSHLRYYRREIILYLVDTRTGAEIWSDRFDGDWTKSMRLQDIITGRLARRLDLELIRLSR